MCLVASAVLAPGHQRLARGDLARARQMCHMRLSIAQRAQAVCLVAFALLAQAIRVSLGYAWRVLVRNLSKAASPLNTGPYGRMALCQHKMSALWEIHHQKKLKR